MGVLGERERGCPEKERGGALAKELVGCFWRRRGCLGLPLSEFKIYHRVETCGGGEGPALACRWRGADVHLAGARSREWEVMKTQGERERG